MDPIHSGFRRLPTAPVLRLVVSHLLEPHSDLDHHHLRLRPFCHYRVVLPDREVVEKGGCETSWGSTQRCTYPLQLAGFPLRFTSTVDSDGADGR